MIEKLKTMRMDVTMSALLSVIIGVLLVVCPAQVIVVFARIIAVILMVSGGAFCVMSLMQTIRSVFGLLVGGIVCLIGLWIFVSPTTVAQIVPIGIGVLLVVHGIQDFSMAVEIKKNGGDYWWATLLAAAVNIIFGIVCVCNAFGLVELVLTVVGLMMIYDGVSDLFIVHKVNKSAKAVVDSTILSEETVDDDYDV